MSINIFITLFCFLYSSSNAQEVDVHLNKELIAKVGTIYEETPDDNPCAGSEIYLTLFFDTEKVSVSEKEVSTCGKESVFEIGNFDWQLMSSNEIKIDFDPQKIKYTYAQNLSLELENNTIIGTIIHLSNTTSKYIFEESNIE